MELPAPETSPPPAPMQAFLGWRPLVATRAAWRQHPGESAGYLHLDRLFPNLSSALRRLNHVGPLGGFEPCVTWVANDSRLTGLSAESTACGPLLASGRAGSCPSQLGKDTNLLHPVFQVFPCRCLITSPSKLGL